MTIDHVRSAAAQVRMERDRLAELEQWRDRVIREVAGISATRQGSLNAPSITAIAGAAGLSRQRVHKILKEGEK